MRFEGLVPNARGVLPGIFVLVNGLAREGLLTVEQERHRRRNNDWYDAAYPNPSHVDPCVYDPAVNPGAVAWFRSSSRELITRVTGYLRTLDAHGVPHRRRLSRDPGRVVYADVHQVVVVPHPPSRRRPGLPISPS
ncbi:hypothetical protein QNO07_06990 [Streptomyces sp. 549]|uniref:hypothetical protein n=1 Tax=Streptomyces sp. 549 TaxID=3049076 RepID=UPI0024C26FCD|nr:hypothetical protein [Streptomyces sp. 549]MDK1473168.1 hypothetical protein [Streptomyces sp. 549]